MAGPLDSLIVNQGAFPAPGEISLPQPVINPVQPVAPAPPPTPAGAAPSGGGLPAGMTKDQVLDTISQNESGGQNVLQNVYSGVGINPSTGTHTAPSTASGLYQITDTTWKNWAPHVGVDINRFPTAMSAPKEIQRQVAAYGLDTEGLAPWAPYNPRLAAALGGGSLSLQERAAAIAKVQADKNREAEGLDKTASVAIKNIGEMQGDLGRVMERVRNAQTKADEANDAAKAAISKAPQQPDINGFKQLNGLAVLVGVLGGLFTKTPMRTSINAAASAIEAYNDHDREAYETSYRNWKTQTDLLFKISDMTQNRVKDILYAENMGFNEKNALLDSTLRAAGLTDLANRRRTEGDQAIQEWMDHISDARQKQQELELKDRELHEYRMAQLNTDKTEAQVIGRMIDMEDAEIYAKTGQHMSATDRTKRFEEIKSGSRGQSANAAEKADVNAFVDNYVSDYQAAHPDEKLTPDKIAKLRLEGRGEANNTIKGIGVITDEAADINAEMMILGDPKVLTSLPRSGPSRTKVENKFAEKLRAQPEAARAVIMNRLRMLEADSAARTAGRVTMQTEIFSKEASDAGAEVIRTSKLVPRTDSPIFNRALEAFYRQEGDPNIIAFGASLNALVNAYGKMSNPTGTGVHDADKERLAHTIDTTLAQGQIEAGVNQIITEGRIISGAAQAAQASVLQGLAPTGLNPSGGAPSPTPSPTIPTVSNQADYDKLPPGATYKGPDGRQYTKGK